VWVFIISQAHFSSVWELFYIRHLFSELSRSHFIWGKSSSRGTTYLIWWEHLSLGALLYEEIQFRRSIWFEGEFSGVLEEAVLFDYAEEKRSDTQVEGLLVLGISSWLCFRISRCDTATDFVCNREVGLLFILNWNSYSDKSDSEELAISAFALPHLYWLRA